MTKTELMKTYTAEQLADMVVNLQNGKENKVFKVQANKNYQKELDEFLKESSIHNSIDKICKDILEQKNNAMAMEFTRIICDLLKRYGVYVHCTETKFGEEITTNSIEEQYGIVFDSVDFSEHDKEFADEIEKLKKELNIKQNAINQIDSIICELFGVAHNGDTYSDDFKELLRENSAVRKTVVDFLPTEPIKVAEMLINAEGEYEHNPLVKKICGNDKGTYQIFDISELRQIAEHLLVYCNHNKEEEE